MQSTSVCRHEKMLLPLLQRKRHHNNKTTITPRPTRTRELYLISAPHCLLTGKLISYNFINCYCKCLLIMYYSDIYFKSQLRGIFSRMMVVQFSNKGQIEKRFVLFIFYVACSVSICHKRYGIFYVPK